MGNKGSDKLDWDYKYNSSLYQSSDKRHFVVISNCGQFYLNFIWILSAERNKLNLPTKGNVTIYLSLWVSAKRIVNNIQTELILVPHSILSCRKLAWRHNLNNFENYSLRIGSIKVVSFQFLSQICIKEYLRVEGVKYIFYLMFWTNPFKPIVDH